MNKYWPILKNKYFLASLVLVVMLLFFEDINLFRLYQYKQQLNALKTENVNRAKEIERIKVKTEELTSDPDALERFARETYKMKAKDEVVFLFVHESEKDK